MSEVANPSQLERPTPLARPFQLDRPRVARWMPREHGAWAQLAFPMLTALVVGGPGFIGALVVIASLSAFVGHEPLTVLLGGRGARRRQEDARIAARLVAAAAAVSVIVGALALSLAEREVRLLLLGVAIPAAGLALLAVLGKEKSTGGELLAGWVFALLALPIAASRQESGWLVAASWALCFTLSTLSLRGVTVRAHGKRDPAAQLRAAWLGRAGALLGALGLALSILMMATGSLPAAIVGGIAPFALFSIVCWYSPPKPARLKQVGWGLAACCSVTFVVLAVGLRG